ncbi:MAG: FecR domain-containing protein, partial [Desulforhopalus sp.]|nr:FecR domain-containing protein [Desulforhopalus sp.]
MGNVMRYLNLLFLFVAGGVLLAGVAVAATDNEEEILVGRIAHVEGKLLRYIEEEKDWVVTVKDAPFGLEDALYSGEDTKAEFIMPNRTWLRIGENTQLQLIALNFDTTTVDVASGLARLYNKSDDAMVKVSTPFGSVVAPGGAAFDLYVGDESLEVIAVHGTVDFIHDGSSARYEVREGESSIIANEGEVARGNGTVDADWDDWNDERDDLWARRLQQSERSAAFLPEAIREESHVFEEHGHWERVYYEGEYRDMWRPTRVQVGWRPFTAGRWTVYYGDNCWIPDEPFGYVTHHYGSWIYIESSRVWYWTPPAPRFAVVVPGFFIGFGWFPGRVGWIHSGPSIGWVPLAPSEPYYGYRPWGRRTVVVTHSPIINISINIGRYRYLDEAVVVNRDHFYRGSTYAPIVQRNLNRDIIINNYRPVTVINNTVINNFEINRHRFTYNDVEVARKPHTSVINRIHDNHRTSRGIEPINRQRIERDLSRFRPRSEPPTRVEVPRPMLTPKLVPAENIAKPIKTLALQQKDIKPQERERRLDGDKRRPPRSPEREKVDQPREPVVQEDRGRSKLPSGFRGETVEQMNRKRDVLQPPEVGRDAQEKRTRTPQQETIQSPLEPPQRPEALQRKKPREEGLQRDQIAGPRDDQPRLRSPRDKGRQEAGQVTPSEERIRPPEEIRLRQEQRLQRQRREEGQQPKDQEIKPPQRQDDKRRQEQDLQGQQQEDQQIRQKQERQHFPQEEVQRRQDSAVRPPERRQDSTVKLPQQPDDREIQQRQNQDNQRRKEQDLQRQQQEVQQVRQKQERQRQQEEDGQRQQAEELKQRQQQDDKR